MLEYKIWMNLFFPKILDRGVQIPIESLQNIVETDNVITANITGKEKYTIELKKDFSEMKCTCPCDGYYCKHEVVLFRYLSVNREEIFNSFLGSNLYSNMKIKDRDDKKVVSDKNNENDKFDNLVNNKEYKELNDLLLEIDEIDSNT